MTAMDDLRRDVQKSLVANDVAIGSNPAAEPNKPTSKVPGEGSPQLQPVTKKPVSKKPVNKQSPTDNSSNAKPSSRAATRRKK